MPSVALATGVSGSIAAPPVVRGVRPRSRLSPVGSLSTSAVSFSRTPSVGACPEADPVDFAKTLDAAGLPKSAYDNFLSQLRTELPVISANHVTLSDGTFTTASKQKDLLYDYQTLQYYLLFD